MEDHVFTSIVEYSKIGVNEFVVEFDLLLSQFVVIGVYLVDELSIEVDQLLKLLLQ